MDRFLTTYRKAYTPKKIPYEGKRKHAIQAEYTDPLSVPFKPHIDVEESGPDCVEEVESYFNKVKWFTIHKINAISK